MAFDGAMADERISGCRIEICNALAVLSDIRSISGSSAMLHGAFIQHRRRGACRTQIDGLLVAEVKPAGDTIDTSADAESSKSVSGQDPASPVE
jgi:hypothetical protein